MSEVSADEVKQLDTAQRGHHPDSPSSLQASEACPQFENEQREVNRAADAGTLQHKAAETRDLTILHGDEAMTEAVQKAINYEDSIIHYFRTELRVEPVVLREQYLPVGDDQVRDKNGTLWDGITGGFPDDVILSLAVGEAHVPDWKFGKEPVTPTRDNLQGWAYALAVFQRFPQIKRCTVHFYAPYQGWSEDEQNEKYVHTFVREQMKEMELRIRTVIARKKDPNSKPCPKTDLCLWCAKKATCQPLLDKVLKISEKYEELMVPDVAAPHKLALPSQFAAAHKFASQIELWAKAVKQRCADVVLTEGIEIPGYRLQKRADRKVQSVVEFARAARKNGVRLREFFNMMTVPITKVEELVKSRAPKGKGAAAIRQLTSDLEESGATAKGTPYHFLAEIKSPAQKEEPFINI